MKNRSTKVGSELEDVVFDSDDPDFCQNNSTVLMKNNNSNLTNAGDGLIAMPSGSHVASVKFKIPAATVSLANIHCPLGDIYSPLGRSSVSVSSSLSDLVGSPLEISVDDVVTIEELRQHIGSCFTCGVSWTDDHISLDCSECGGYSLERPCPLCDGKCGVQWKRDFTMSHTSGKARWVGVCPNYPEALNSTAVVNITTTTTSCVAAAATQVRLARELCTRLEQLTRSASSFSHTHI